MITKMGEVEHDEPVMGGGIACLPYGRCEDFLIERSV